MNYYCKLQVKQEAKSFPGKSNTIHQVKRHLKKVKKKDNCRFTK